MKNITLFFDLLITILSIWALLKLTSYGGIIGRYLSMVGYGLIIIGLSQIFETISLNFINANVSLVEIIHRIILLLGLVLVAWGFKKLLIQK